MVELPQIKIEQCFSRAFLKRDEFLNFNYELNWENVIEIKLVQIHIFVNTFTEIELK